MQKHPTSPSEDENQIFQSIKFISIVFHFNTFCIDTGLSDVFEIHSIIWASALALVFLRTSPIFFHFGWSFSSYWNILNCSSCISFPILDILIRLELLKKIYWLGLSLVWH